MFNTLGQIYARKRLKNRYGFKNKWATYLIKLLMFSFLSTKFAIYFFNDVSNSGVLIVTFFILSSLILMLRSISIIRNPSNADTLFPFGLTQKQLEDFTFYNLFYESGMMILGSIITLFFSYLFFKANYHGTILFIGIILFLCLFTMLSLKVLILRNWLKPKKDVFALSSTTPKFVNNTPSFQFLGQLLIRLVKIAPLSIRMLLAISLKSVFRKNPIYFLMLIVMPIILSLALFSAPPAFFPIFIITGALLSSELVTYFHEATFTMPAWNYIFPCSESHHQHAHFLLLLFITLPYVIIGAMYALIKNLLLSFTCCHSFGTFLILISLFSIFGAKHRRQPFIASVWSIIFIIIFGLSFLFPILAIPIFVFGMVWIIVQFNSIRRLIYD